MAELANFPVDLIDEAVLISRTDPSGKITYVNNKFVEISGWSRDEVIGQDHRIVNSGIHAKEFWKNMYQETIFDRKIWNSIVTNRSKCGNVYHVDTYIKAEFDTAGNLTGFTSVRQDVTRIIETLETLNKKNTYLEHAAKILRHDMHSGINTYIPRGVRSLERRLTKEAIENYKLEPPLRLLKEGLTHTQRVYRGVREFTNLVKEDKNLSKDDCDLGAILKNFLSSTSYNDQVFIEVLPTVEVNEPLFCTAIDNLIRNGLKYNDSETKLVWIYMEGDKTLVVQDNGRGMSQEELDQYSKPYKRGKNQKESGTGLGLNICVAILKEHGFSVTCENANPGTKLKVRLQ
jgi:PAS domain S-box-containing protein